MIINGHPAWDAFLVALAAFLVTAGGTYAWRFLFVAPYQMYQAVEQERDAAKIKLGHIEVTREKLTGLTDLRSIGISQFNEAPSTLGSLTAWHDKWRAWEQSVVAYLNDHFSPAEASLFHRLGKIPTHRFAQSEDAMHNHYLSCLSKELDILDKTVERHLPGSHVAR